MSDKFSVAANLYAMDYKEVGQNAAQPREEPPEYDLNEGNEEPLRDPIMEKKLARRASIRDRIDSFIQNPVKNDGDLFIYLFMMVHVS